MPYGVGGAMINEAASTETLVIRPAQTGDAEAMVAYMTALTDEGLDTISVRVAPTLEDEREFVLRSKLSERILILLAFAGEEMVGMLDLSAGQRPSDRHAGRFGMSVAKAWRSKGVGRKLLAAAIEETKGWPGFCRIELECAPWNAPAIALYESLGFKLEATRRKALNLRGRPEDMLLMALTW
jgi:RimJ/RimL family protein N-acetyltransferase